MSRAEAPPAVAADGPVLPADVVLRSLGAACGLDLTAFRAPHVARTVARAVARLGLVGDAALPAALMADPTARARFRRAMAVSTSGMFRDPEQFELLDRLMRDEGPPGRPPRVWSIGAADGSELCSVALLLERQGTPAGATLLGSDLLPENVELARVLAHERLGPQPPSPVRFEQRDVVRSSPSGSFDLVLCRNVLIHLAPAARSAMLARAAEAVAPGGLLLLGRSERLPRGERHGLGDAGANAYRRPV